jgi:pimeloyl-ACP methyl ester carboxylesterase
VELGERLAKRLGARIEIVEHARHFVPSERPEQVTRALRTFLGP